MEMERTSKPEQTLTPAHAKEIMALTLARADIAKKPPLHTVDNTGETTNEKRTTAIPEWRGRDESGPQGREYSKPTPYSVLGRSLLSTAWTTRTDKSLASPVCPDE
jgi:hypothetical protein